MSGTRISSLFGKITILFILCCLTLSAQAKYGGGTGESNDPYQIRDANHMQAIGADANDWDKHFLLCADVDLAGYVGEQFNIIGIDHDNPFTGVFDGNGHTISNFSFTSTDRVYTGLFGNVSDPNAQIKDVRLIDPNVNNGEIPALIGSLVGYLDNGTITNCYVQGASVSGSGPAGGLVGANDGTITSCCSTGDVNALTPVGGLAGSNMGIISNCYSSANVSWMQVMGGLVGENFGIITNCYSTGRISGCMGIGGLVGKNDGDVWDCFWDIQSSGQDWSDGGEGRTTEQMMQHSTFQDWDFINVWNIGENQTYPYLRTVPTGDINHDRIVNFFDFAIIADQWLEEE